MADSQHGGDGIPRTLFVALMSGVVALLAWFTNHVQERDTFRRDMYSNREDCIQDWGEERNCEQDQTSQMRTGRVGYYYGPWYRSGQYGSSPDVQPDGTVDRARPGSHAIGTAHVSRGGFGGIGAAHGASGS